MTDANEKHAQDLPEDEGPERADDAARSGGAEEEGVEDAGPPSWVVEPGVSRLAPRWWIKTLAFAVVLIGFGGWGLYDALVAYPERGIADAEHKQLEYLRSWASSALRSEATVADPAAELSRLEEASRRQSNTVTDAEARRLEWLRSLQKVARLRPEHTRIESPIQKLQELENSWATRTPPKPLAAYDIPAQWLFVAIGFSIGPWLLFKFVVVSGKKYRWDPVGQRLTVPGGQTLSPGDLEDVDKRKWDKFIVFLRVKSSHAGLGGQEVKVDLYHYTQPVEDWVLAMEKTAFPDRAKEDEEAEGNDDEAGDGDGSGDGGGDD